MQLKFQLLCFPPPLQEEGLSASEIAAMLKLSEATVKYHNKEIYRKLGVKNKTAAIAEAKKRKLI